MPTSGPACSTISAASASPRPIPRPASPDRWPRRRRPPCSAPATASRRPAGSRSEEHTSELQSRQYLVCRLLLERSGNTPDLHSFPTRRSSDLVPQSISVTYANAYKRASVLDDLCGFSFAAANPATGIPGPLAPAAEAALFGTSNGIPPTGGVEIGRAHV